MLRISKVDFLEHAADIMISASGAEIVRRRA
jgi:hypothetical protein